VVTLQDPSQPLYVEGYHKGSATDPDDAVYDAITDVLSNGRTSRLYRSLVRDKQIAVAAQALGGFPGDKYPNLFIVFGVPARGHSNQEVKEAIRAELTRLKNEDISDEELAMVKTRTKADVIRSMSSNGGIAGNLAEYQTRFGDWRQLFLDVEKIEKVTKADIRRVASKTFVDSNRTVGMIETAAAPSGTGKQSGR